MDGELALLQNSVIYDYNRSTLRMKIEFIYIDIFPRSYITSRTNFVFD